MPTWFFLLLLALVAFAILIAIGMAYSRRSTAAGGQNTTIIERESSASDQNTTVVERD